ALLLLVRGAHDGHGDGSADRERRRHRREPDGHEMALHLFPDVERVVPLASERLKGPRQLEARNVGAPFDTFAFLVRHATRSLSCCTSSFKRRRVSPKGFSGNRWTPKSARAAATASRITPVTSAAIVPPSARARATRRSATPTSALAAAIPSVIALTFRSF